MSKTIRKMMLDDIWNLGRNESWFSDMAGNGLHLQRIGCIFAVFHKGEPRNIRYRIDVLSNAPTEEQLEIYQESGWQFVTNNGELYIFSSPDEAGYPELHTDPVEQSYTLTALTKRLRNNVVILSLLLALFAVMMVYVLFLNPTPTLAMMDTTWIQRPLLVLAECYAFIAVLRNFLAVRSLKKSLSEGKPMNHRESWRKPRLVNGALGAFFIIVALLAASMPFFEIAGSKNYTLPETSENLPVIRLAEIEKNPSLEREAGYTSSGVDWSNRVSYDWSLLAPVQYEINEHCIVKNEMWDDKSGYYSPSIETHYYQLAFPSMGGSLTRDLMERYVDDFRKDVMIQEVNNGFFNKLFVAEDGIRKQIFACSGNEVIYINYFGNAQAEDIIVLLPQAFSGGGS